MRIQPRDAIFIAIFTLALIGLYAVTRYRELLAAAVAVALLGFLLLEIYRRLQAQHETSLRHWESRVDNLNRQMQSLFSLYRYLDISHPLPPLSGWSLTPDILNMIVEEIDRQKPGLVLELGSGLSTVLIGYALRKNGGRVVSLEHDETFFKNTRALIGQHGLGGVAKVILAPLEEYELSGVRWQWYAKRAYGDVRDIDVLIIDGPPDYIQRCSRYPALPLLRPLLSPKAVIFLDDARRNSEREALRLWQREFSRLRMEIREEGKGVARLWFSTEPSQD